MNKENKSQNINNNNSIKVAYQGLLGTYSEQAIVNFAKKYNLNLESHSTKDFRNLFETINNQTYLGMVPIENSTAGSVTQCYDLFLEYDFEIIAEYKLIVNHCLLAKKETKIEDIKEVYSHPQALAQCSNFLEKNNITPISYLDTAASAKFVQESKKNNKIASISSEIAAEHYKLEIKKIEFQNNKQNMTRFLLVKKKGHNFEFEKSLPTTNKSSIIFQTRDIPAALYKCLGGFATNDINLTKIESRPVQNKNINFDYIFYIDIQGTFKDKNVIQAIEELEFFSQKIIRLGSYTADD